MDPNVWRTALEKAFRSLELYAAARRESRRLLAEKTERMKAWYEWRTNEVAKIDARYDAAEASMCADLLPEISKATATETARKCEALTVVGMVETKHRQLLAGGSELPPITRPENVTVAFTISPEVLDASAVPASLLTLDVARAAESLKTENIPGVFAKFVPSITVRK
jgi:hypothetical protein